MGHCLTDGIYRNYAGETKQGCIEICTMEQDCLGFTYSPSNMECTTFFDSVTTIGVDPTNSDIECWQEKASNSHFDGNFGLGCCVCQLQFPLSNSKQFTRPKKFFMLNSVSVL